MWQTRQSMGNESDTFAVGEIGLGRIDRTSRWCNRRQKRNSFDELRLFLD